VGTNSRGNGDGMWCECIVVFVGKEVIGGERRTNLYRLINGVVVENLGKMGGRLCFGIICIYINNEFCCFLYMYSDFTY